MTIKFLIMDVDGTLTDGKIYMGETGELFKAFDIKDGCGIHDLLIPQNVIPIIITGRQSVIVENRCRELGITEIYQNVHNKLDTLNRLMRQNECSLSETAYIGDDINDISCMKEIKMSGGLVGCPFDASPEVKDLADFVCTKNGGNGAVREFIEYVLSDK